MPGLASGKLVCGHARGLAGADLQGFAAAGIESDHEITSGEDLLAKLRAGFTVELRGSHDYVLPGAVEALNALPQLPQTLTICTDDVFPDDLVAVGGMIDVLRRLVRYGLAPMQALRGATLNAAMRLGRRDLGLVGAGAARRSDRAVGSGRAGGDAGVRVGRGWSPRMVDCWRRCRPTRRARRSDTMHVPPLAAEDFRLRAPGVNAGRVRLRTVAKPRFTEWGEVDRRGARRRRGAAGRRHPDGGDPSPRPGAGARRCSACCKAGARGAARWRPRSRMTATTWWCSAATRPTWRRRPTR